LALVAVMVVAATRSFAVSAKRFERVGIVVVGQTSADIDKVMRKNFLRRGINFLKKFGIRFLTTVVNVVYSSEVRRS